MLAPFKFGPILGKGNGLVATRDIRRGTNVISESPLINTLKAHDEVFSDESILRNAQNQGVSDEDWETFRGFYTRFDSSKVGDICGRFLSGSFDRYYMQSTPQGMIFLNISRITHSCSPNCVYSFHSKKSEGRLYAVKDIKEGEELSICYAAGRSGPLQHRRSRLKLERGFDCLCDLCRKTGAGLAQSEERLRQIDHLTSIQHSTLQRHGDSRIHLVKCQRAITLRLRYLREEGITDDREAQCYMEMYGVLTRLGSMAWARRYLRLYLKAQTDCFGEDGIGLLPDCQEA